MPPASLVQPQRAVYYVAHRGFCKNSTISASVGALAE
jgi:hypothetical protein